MFIFLSGKRERNWCISSSSHTLVCTFYWYERCHFLLPRKLRKVPPFLVLKVASNIGDSEATKNYHGIKSDFYGVFLLCVHNHGDFFLCRIIQWLRNNVFYIPTSGLVGLTCYQNQLLSLFVHLRFSLLQIRYYKYLLFYGLWAKWNNQHVQ